MSKAANTLERRERWRGHYRGITYEVSCHYRGWHDHDVRTGEPRRACWAFYLYIPEAMVPEAKRDRFIAKRYPPEQMHGNPCHYDYYATALAHLEWHGGITYYTIHNADLVGYRVIEAGCDYQHAFDDGVRYDAESVACDARTCIDTLHTFHPDLLVRDWYDGSYHPREEMEETPQGWLSAQGKAKLKAQTRSEE
jgi:hypothetical protein